MTSSEVAQSPACPIVITIDWRWLRTIDELRAHFPVDETDISAKSPGHEDCLCSVDLAAVLARAGAVTTERFPGHIQVLDPRYTKNWDPNA